MTLADSVNAGRRALLAGHWHVLVADLDLGPGPGGVDLLRLARDAVQTALAALAASAFGAEHDRAVTRQAGFDLHVVKPIHGDDLVQSVRDVVEARPPRSA